MIAQVLLVATLLGCSSEHSFPFPQTQMLTESVAIEVTRNALQAEHIAVESLAPVTFQSKQSADAEPYFARNQKQPDRGYVLWKKAGSTREWDFQVYISRDGESLRCTVTKGS